MVYHLFALSFESLQFFVVTVLAECHSFFLLEGVFHSSTLYFRRSCVLRGSLSAWQTTAFLGICFKFPRFLFWTSTRIERISWDFFHAWPPKSSSLPIRRNFILCSKSLWWKIKSAALVHTTLAEVILPSTAFRDLVLSLICSSMQFLLLQAQLMYLFLSDVLIVSISEILV